MDAEYAGDGRRSGLVTFVVFDEAARRGSPGSSSTRGSRSEEGWRDRERQRRDQDPCLRPTTPERSGSVVRRDRGHGLIRTNDAEPLEAAPSRPSVDRCRSWRLVVKRGSTRSCPPPRFRPGGAPWKPASPAKVGGEGDSRIERSKGCSSCRSVADAGENASSQAGRSRPQGRERRRRVSPTRRLHVDDGGAARSGRKGAG